MNVGDFAALIVVCLTVAALIALVVAIVEVRKTMVQLRETLTKIDAESTAALTELRETLDLAAGDLDRVDELIGAAESISARVDATSRLTSTALSAPVIKTVAFASGSRRAARRLRGKDDDDHTRHDGVRNER